MAACCPCCRREFRPLRDSRAADLPLVIEIVDSEEKINAFLPVLDKMIGGGLVTMEKVKVLHYRSGNGEK